MDIETLALAKNYTQESVAGLWDKWSSASSYAKGQIVLYNGVPYQAKQATTAGTWVASEWQQINISDALEKIDDCIQIVKLTNGSETLAQLNERLNTINTAGKHVFFDTSAISPNILYLCTIYIDSYASPTKYRVFDCVTGMTSIGTYDASKTLSTILSESVADLVTISVTCTAQGTTVTGQTVTLRNGSASAPVIATKLYNGQPISFVVAKNTAYHISVSDTLEGFSAPPSITGYAVNNVSLTFTYRSGVIYAFHIDGTKSNPLEMVTYPEGCDNEDFDSAYMDYATGEFNYGDWENAFFMPRPCMLKSDGTVDYYLDENDYAKKANGTASDIANTSYDGNAMMEWGRNGNKIFYKVVPDTGDTKSATVYIANSNVDGDYKYYSFINNQGTVVDHFYTPIYNGSLVDNKLRSLSGQNCMNSKSGTDEITYATANNSSATIWYTETYADIQLINLLLILIGKSTNTQTVFGNGHYTGGSSAGNLLTTGTMNDKGMFYGTNSTGSGVKVFGMENWWGNQWRRYAGHINSSGTQKIKLTYGMQDGSTTGAYNTDGTGYISLGLTPSGSSGGYINEMSFNEYGMFPSKSSGSDSTYYCDGLYFNNSDTRYAFRGGYCNGGWPVGAFCGCLNRAVSGSSWDIGAALSCKPLA